MQGIMSVITMLKEIMKEGDVNNDEVVNNDNT